jgi:hypothetical protein
VAGRPSLKLVFDRRAEAAGPARRAADCLGLDKGVAVYRVSHKFINYLALPIVLWEPYRTFPSKKIREIG